jgi:lipopolysaccharide transport system ATP-binding protein
LKISIGYQSTTPLVRPQFSATVFDSLRGVGILEVDSSVVGGIPETLPYQGTVTCITEPLYLTPGRCYVNLDMSIAGVEVDEVQHAAYFDIEHFDIFGGGHIPERDWTICLKNHSWSFSE